MSLSETRDQNPVLGLTNLSRGGLDYKLNKQAEITKKETSGLRDMTNSHWLYNNKLNWGNMLNLKIKKN